MPTTWCGTRRSDAQTEELLGDRPHGIAPRCCMTPAAIASTRALIVGSTLLTVCVYLQFYNEASLSYSG